MQTNRLEAFSDGVIIRSHVVGIVCAWLHSAWLGMFFFVAVALMWVVPDRRVERVAARQHRG